MWVLISLLIACDEAAPKPTCTYTGFEAEPRAWALPQLPYDEGTDPPLFPMPEYSAERTVEGEEQTFHYLIANMDGDELPDMLISRDTAVPELGTDHWLVYPGSVEGYAGEPTEWSLPPYPADDYDDRVAFPDLEASNLRLLGADGWTLFGHFVVDLDADGTPDLAVIVDGEDPAVGVDRWNVHLGGPGGFADEATVWSLPSGEPQEGEAVSSWSEYGGASRSWFLHDMNGDGRVDLVVYLDEADDSIGVNRWRVYDNTGAGFAEPRDWAIPVILQDTGMGHIPWVGGCVDPSYCDRMVDGEQLLFTNALLDMDGDGYLDFLVTADATEPTLGATRWRIWRGGPDGVGGYEDWALPGALHADAALGLWLPALGGEWTEGEGTDTVEYDWAYGDLDLDGYIDLVYTRDEADPAIGTEHWLLWRGGPRGFALFGEPWTLPSMGGEHDGYAAFPSGDGTASRELDGEALSYIFTNFTVDPSGAVGLVILKDQADPDLGTLRWEVYPSVCTDAE